MKRSYDIFEIVPAQGLIWKCSIDGLDEAVLRLKQLAVAESHEFRLMHLESASTIATVNNPSS